MLGKVLAILQVRNAGRPCGTPKLSSGFDPDPFGFVLQEDPTVHISWGGNQDDFQFAHHVRTRFGDWRLC